MSSQSDFFTIQITSVNYNGQGANITFYSNNNPDFPVNLGLNVIPYTRTGSDVFGRYVLNFPAYDAICEANVVSPTTSTTTTGDPSITTTGDPSITTTTTQAPSSLFLPPIISNVTNSNVTLRNMNVATGGFLQLDPQISASITVSASSYIFPTTINSTLDGSSFNVQYFQTIGGASSNINQGNVGSLKQMNTFNFPNPGGFIAPTGSVGSTSVTVNIPFQNLLLLTSDFFEDYSCVVFLERSLDSGSSWLLAGSQVVDKFFDGEKNTNNSFVVFSVATTNSIFRARIIGQTNNFPNNISTSPFGFF
jgi:hypothetical protein